MKKLTFALCTAKLQYIFGFSTIYYRKCGDHIKDSRRITIKCKKMCSYFAGIIAQAGWVSATLTS